MKALTLAFASTVLMSAYAQNAPLLSKSGLPTSKQINTLLSTPLSQTKIANCADATREVVWGKGTRISYTSDGLAISGLGAGGRSWNTVVPASNLLKCEVWSATLTKNGKPSLLVFQAPESGQIFGGELTVLTFDKQDMPYPWQSEGGFTSSQRGIEQVTSDPTTGEVRILVPQRTGDRHDGFGYVTSLFTTSQNGISKFIGKDSSGSSWPDIQGKDTTFTANEKKVTRTASAEDVAVVTSAPAKEIVQISPHDEQQVRYADGSTSKYPRLLVWDKPDQSRTIYIDEFAADATTDLMKAHVPVSLKGVACEDDECGPFIMQSAVAR